MNPYPQLLQRLRKVYSQDEAQALARWVFEERFGLSLTDLLMGKDSDLSADCIENLQEIALRLEQREPVQYILGYTHFCGHRFRVSPAALIPRPETEELVNHVLRSVSNDLPCPHILDIGTGTGCIALSLALSLPHSQVTAWDISPEALALAQENATLLATTNVNWQLQDILNPPHTEERWHVVVSNPPYVRQCEAADMEQNVLNHEPHLALFVPDNDALRFYRAIAVFSMEHLHSQGLLWVEINQYLGEETRHFIEDFGFTDVRLFTDQFGHTRFLSARKP